MTPDGKIIVYGGAKGTNTITATPSLAVLDTSTSIYTWSIPTAQQQNSPPPLILHTADLYGDYMIIAFGQLKFKKFLTFLNLNFNPFQSIRKKILIFIYFFF